MGDIGKPKQYFWTLHNSFFHKFLSSGQQQHQHHMHQGGFQSRQQQLHHQFQSGGHQQRHQHGNQNDGYGDYNNG